MSTTKTTTDRRRRIFSNRTLTLGDLRAIQAQLASTSYDVRMIANDTRLSDIDQLPTVAAEEVFIRRLALSIIGQDDESLQFSYESDFIEIESGLDAAFRKPFAVICALLDSKPANGEPTCGLDLTNNTPPRLAKISGPEEATTRVLRAARAPSPSSVASDVGATNAAGSDRTRTGSSPATVGDPSTAPTPRITGAKQPSHGLSNLLRRLWGGKP